LKAGAGPIGARLFQADFWTSAGTTWVHSDLCHGSSRHCSAVEFGPLPSPSGNGNHLKFKCKFSLSLSSSLVSRHATMLLSGNFDTPSFDFNDEHSVRLLLVLSRSLSLSSCSIREDEQTEVKRERERETQRPSAVSFIRFGLEKCCSGSQVSPLVRSFSSLQHVFDQC
jgi:hypothetical protein